MITDLYTTKKIGFILILLHIETIMSSEFGKKETETTIRYYIQEVLVKCLQQCSEKRSNVS